MKPEDILDGLGNVSDRMVLDAQNLKKSPHRGMKWGSLAACILCGLILLACAQQSCGTGMTSKASDLRNHLRAPVVSQTPQDSAGGIHSSGRYGKRRCGDQ